MNDITATIGCVALDHLEEQLENRQIIGKFYRENLKNLKKVKLLKYPEHAHPNYQIFPIHVQDREVFANFMFTNGIQVNVNNRRNDKYTIFGGIRSDLPNTTLADADVILLPCHNDLTSNNLNKIVDKIKEYDNI